MATDLSALLLAVYTAYREKRLGDALVHFADDFRFTLHLPVGAMPGAGTPLDKAAAARLFEDLMATYDFLAYEPGPISAGGDQAKVRPHIHYRHKATGEVIETTLAHFWRFRDGKAVQLDEYPDVEHVRFFLSKVAVAG
jgi:ketosteroid isomerase-like protein